MAESGYFPHDYNLSQRLEFIQLVLDKITLYNVCAVLWGVFSTVGDIMNTVGIS